MTEFCVYSSNKILNHLNTKFVSYMPTALLEN